MPVVEQLQIVYEPYGKFRINGSNTIARWRCQTFHEKEPTTLEWIQRLTKHSWLIDIGANIGIYTIPASLFHVGRVIALEPEPRNYAELLENLDINLIDDEKVIALPLAISTEFSDQSTKLFLSEEKAGSSCHQLGKNQDHMLKRIQFNRKSRSVYSISLEQLICDSCVPNDVPLHIKVDVDGIENDVCQSLFSSSLIHRLSSIQIELNKDIEKHFELISKLELAGFFYSKVQVEKATRKQGPYSGFAEYIFIPSFSPEIFSMLSLPDNIIEQHQILYNYIGKGKENIVEPVISFNSEESGAITFAAFSCVPPVGIVKSIFTNSQLQRIARSIIDVVRTSRPNLSFKVDNSEYIRDEQLRVSVSSDQLKSIDPEYWDFLRSLFFDKFNVGKILSVSRNINSPDARNRFPLQKNKLGRITGANVVCRIRHFVDLHGFYLTRHVDSSDTITALVIPLLPYSTSTSVMFPTGRPRYNYCAFKNRGNLLPGSFSNQLEVYMQDKNIYCERIKGEEYHYSLKKVPLEPGEGALISNPLSILYDLVDTHRDIYNHTSGHGVFPPMVDLVRPVLLVDYLLKYDEELDSLFSKSSEDLSMIFKLSEVFDF